MINIAIDGPSGAGKSTIAKELSKRLNIIYLDTGAMYRAVGLYAITNNISPLDKASVIQTLKNIDIDVKYIDDKQNIILNGENVTSAIRENHISKAASDVSAIKEVREKLVEQQQKIAGKISCILDGRDIATVVLPNAEFKFFITADTNIRAKRRYKELCDKGQKVEFDKVLADMQLRDYNDSHREVSPLTVAEGSTVIDTTKYSIEQVIKIIIDMINTKR